MKAQKRFANVRREGNWFRMLGGIGTALLFWLLTQFGVLALLDGFFYDLVFKAAVQLKAGITNQPSKVVLIEIEAERERLSEQELLQAVSYLREFEPGLLVFSFIPRNLTPAGMKQISAGGPAVFGHHLQTLPDEVPRGKLQVTKEIETDPNLTVGVVEVPPVNWGICRRVETSRHIDGQRYDNLETAAARAFPGHWLPDPLPRRFRVNFRGGSGSLPVIKFRRVIRKDLVKELVKDRCILFGSGRDSSVVGLSTPTTYGRRMMSLLEYQGHAVNTLINRKIIYVSGSIFNLLLFILATVFSMALYRRLTSRMDNWLTILALVFYFTLGVICFAWLRLWLPVGNLMLMQMVIFFIGLSHKSITADRGFQDLLLDLNSRLRERYFPTSIYRVKEHWTQVVTMVIQTFSLERLIFLKRVEKDHRVREVESFNCSLTDIDERRRDYLRFPYDEAIKKNGPIELTDRRPYLKVKDEAERQFLVPLSFAGDIRGFWVFGVKSVIMENSSNFIDQIRDYAVIIGELLFNRQEIQRQDAGGGRMVRLLTTDREEELYLALKQTVELLKRISDNITNLFDSLSIMAIEYDIFGRVLAVNKKMLELLKANSLAPYQMSLTDLVVKLTGVEADVVRQRLRKVVNQHQVVTYSVKLGGNNYLLAVKPLESAARGDEYEDPAPFGITGLICELTETTSMLELQKMKEQLVGEIGQSLRHELVVLSQELKQLEARQGEDIEACRPVLGNALSRVETGLSLLNRSDYFLSAHADLTDYSKTFPVNAPVYLNRALEKSEPEMKRQKVTYELHVPEDLKYAFAQPDFLRRLFARILAVLLDDTITGGSIRISAREESGWVRFDFKNTGYGIPEEQLQRLLFGSNGNLAHPMRRLREALDWVQTWFGQLEAHSRVGGGLHLTLRLMRDK